MSRQPLGELSSLAGLAHVVEKDEQVLHYSNVVSALARVAKSELVGLIFVFPAELEEQKVEPGAEHLIGLADCRAQERSNAEAKLSQLLFAELVDRMARRDVTNLMAHHR